MRTLTIALAAGLLTTPAAAQRMVTRILECPDCASGDLFARAVAIEGDYAVVGAPYHDAGAQNAGAAYVFDTRTGELLYKVMQPVPGLDDEFGAAVTINGNFIAVGATHDATIPATRGAVYVYDAPSGQLLYSISNSGWFGRHADAHNGVLAVAAWHYNQPHTATGRVFLYDMATGAPLQERIPVTGIGDSRYGFSLRIHNMQTIARGRTYSDNGTTCVMFDAHGVQTLRFFAPDHAVENQVMTTEINANFVITGSPNAPTYGTDSGGVLVHDIAAGIKVHTPLPPNLAAHDHFGLTLAANDDTLVAYSQGANGVPWQTSQFTLHYFDINTGQWKGAAPEPTSHPGVVIATELGLQAIDIDDHQVIASARHLTSPARACAVLLDIPCSPADTAPPYGELSYADITQYLRDLQAYGPESNFLADLAPPKGITFADIRVFLDAYAAGCP